MASKNIFDSTVTNDRIDIYKAPDTNAKILKSDSEHEIKIELSGQSIDNSVANALRRTVMMLIPIYGFHRSNIFIENDKSRNMYNNDMIYNQIETLPIFDIPNYFDLEDPETFLPTEIMKELFSKFIQQKNTNTEEEPVDEDLSKKLFNIELTINMKNNTSEDIFVSSHHAVLKIDGKISESYKKRPPICLLVIKPTEEISMRAIANLGIAKIHAIYEATTNAISEEITPSKYHIWYDTLQQLDKKVIFTKACVILAKKLEYLATYIKKNYSKDRNVDETIEIPINGEEHTLGNLLATVLQKCEFVEKAAYFTPHPFIDQIVVKYKLFPTSKKGPIKILTDCIDYLIKVFQSIEKITTKL